MQIKYHDETKRKKFQSNLSNFHWLNEGKKKIEKKKHTQSRIYRILNVDTFFSKRFFPTRLGGMRMNAIGECKWHWRTRYCANRRENGIAGYACVSVSVFERRAWNPPFQCSYGDLTGCVSPTSPSTPFQIINIASGPRSFVIQEY